MTSAENGTGTGPVPENGPVPGTAAHARPGPDSARSGGSSSISHIIYTSGSEGRPKGIALGHRGLVDLVRWQHRRFGTGPGTRTAVVCSQSFDVSLLEIWPTLTAGGCLVVADEEVRRDPRALSRWYEREGVTVTALPTALAEQVLALPPREQPPLRHLLCGGEQLTRRPHADAPYETVNIYGPSEVTVLALAYTVPAAAPGVSGDGDGVSDDGPIPLGYPVDNVRLDVLDAEGRPVPPGTVGELHIGGPGVGLGYHRAPERTAERFVPTTDGVRFHSGDLVEMNAEGALVFRGRTDDQVKISGFRVEPAEPDRVLRELPGVRNAAVVARRDAERGHRLVGYVVPADGEPADEDAYLAGLERQLGERLPHYMVPREWALLPRLPLNVNGKLDRAALPPGRVPGLAPPPPPPPPSLPAEDAAAVEAKVRKLWADVLGADTGHLADDVPFFSVGGDSLAAIRLVGRVAEEFGADYPVVDFFERPTLRAMTDRLAGPGSGPDPGPGLSPGPGPDDRVRGEV